MKLVIYLGEDNIKVVLGRHGTRLRVKSCHTYELPKGTLINGVVTDPAVFCEVLKEIAAAYRRYAGHVHLVLGSSKIITRMMKVPDMSKRALLDVAQKELKSFLVNGEEDMVYDYGRVNGESILCAASQRKLITGYCREFRHCGLKVKTIDTALNSVVIFAENLALLKGKTYILAVLDGRNMISTLYVKGKYVYTSRLRLVSERETPEICYEIMRHMGAVRRFGENQNKGVRIDHVYFCGLSGMEEDTLYPSVKDELDMEPSSLKLNAEGIETDVSSYIYAAGNLISRDHEKCLNLVTAAKRKNTKEKKTFLKMAAAYTIPFIVTAYFAGSYFITMGRTWKIRKETARIEAYLNDPAMAVKIDEAVWESREMDRYKDLAERLKTESAMMEEYPRISGDIMRVIEAAGEGRIQFDSFAYSDGMVTFTASADDLGEGAGFAARLEESGIFERAGYYKMEKKELYCFYMECMIKKTPERSGL